MKKLTLIIAIVFSGMLMQAQDKIVMNNGDIYEGVITGQNDKYVQITDNDVDKYFLLDDVDQILQENKFHWDKIVEQPGTKEKLFTKVKIVIADIYRSAQDVTQNSDENEGIIQIKASTTQSFKRNMMYSTQYTYSYSVKLLFKDDKFRIIIDGIQPTIAIWGGTGAPISCPPLDPALERKFSKHSVTKKQYYEMVEYFYNELDLVVNTIINDLQSEVTTDNNDW